MGWGVRAAESVLPGRSGWWEPGAGGRQAGSQGMSIPCTPATPSVYTTSTPPLGEEGPHPPSGRRVDWLLGILSLCHPG